MAEEPTKTQATLTALKNANKHLTDILNQNDAMNRCMGGAASDLQFAIRAVGELHIQVWEGGGYKSISLKSYLSKISSNLEQGRV